MAEINLSGFCFLRGSGQVVEFNGTLCKKKMLEVVGRMKQKKKVCENTHLGDNVRKQGKIVSRFLVSILVSSLSSSSSYVDSLM